MPDHPSTTAVPAARQIVARPYQSRTTTRPMVVRANGRTAQGRRIRDLFRAFIARIDPGDVPGCAAALSAAELRVAAEVCRAALLAKAVDAAMIDACVRIEGAADRAERKLSRFAVVKQPQSLAAYLAARHGDGAAGAGTK